MFIAIEKNAEPVYSIVECLQQSTIGQFYVDRESKNELYLVISSRGDKCVLDVQKGFTLNPDQCKNLLLLRLKDSKIIITA